MQSRSRAIACVAVCLASGSAVRAEPSARVIAGAGTASHVVVREGDDPIASFFAYGPSFTGGVRVALGDVSGDGIPDLVTGPGPGAGPHLKVFDGMSGAELWSFFAYEPAFTGGIFVAAGDVDGDGRDDVVTGADAGGAPHVKVFDGATQAPIADFLAFTPSFTGGVRVATGDVNGDGLADLVLGTGPGAASVEIRSGTNHALLDSYPAYSLFTGGVFVAAGDLDGDGFAEQVVGPDAGSAPHVRVFDGRTGNDAGSLFPFPTMFMGGVRVATGDLDGDGRADLVLGAGAGSTPTVRRLRGYDRASLGDFLAFAPDFTGGIYVGGVPVPEPEASAGAALLAMLCLVRRRERLRPLD